MTTTFDPTHPAYLDEADVRTELARVHDVCLTCRRCADLCVSFESLFELLDRLDEPEGGALTPDQQDHVVGACFQCSSCLIECPYTPDRDEASVDVPRMVLRAQAMRWKHGHLSGSDRRAVRTLRRTDRIGRLATRVASVSNRLLHAPSGSRRRRLLSLVTGLSAMRSLGTFAGQTFTTWFAERPKITLARARRSVRVYPTCLVEYQATGLGKDLVGVFERNGIQCSPSSAGCCGAPLLHAGDLDGFRKVARKNVRRLAAEIRSGDDLIVPEPGCGEVLRRRYVDYVSEGLRADAELVAGHTFDAAEYLMDLHMSGDTGLETDFVGAARVSIAELSSGSLRVQTGHLRGRDVLRLTGANVRVVSVPSGVGGVWSLRSDHDEVASASADRLAAAIDEADASAVTADSTLTAQAVQHATNRRVLHPIQVVARAYGLTSDPAE